MMFVEVFVPAGTLTEEQRRRINARFIAEMTEGGGEAGAPEEVLDTARGLFQLVFHETSAWFAGGIEIGVGEPPRFLVRVSVPQEWLEDMSGHMVKTMTGILAEVDGGDRLYEKPHAVVHVLAVPDGGCGIFGRVMTSGDLVRLITKSHRETPRMPENLPQGTGFDPVCGMTVPLKHAAAVAEYDGTTYAFCSKGCHEVYAEDHAAV